MKKKITLRSELHEIIYDKVINTEHKALRVLRKPNKTQQQPAPKLIVVVENEEQARSIKENCLNLIAKANEELNKRFEYSAFTLRDVKYSINIIHSQSDILLSVSDAQRRKKMNGEKIKSKLQKSYDDLVAKQEMEHEYFDAKADKYKSNIKDIEDCINSLDDDKDYIFAESTGKSYRITYFDGEQRQQISAGNLLIVVNPYNIQILDAPSRKKRSDKKYYLYFLHASYSTIAIYPA